MPHNEAGYCAPVFIKLEGAFLLPYVFNGINCRIPVAGYAADGNSGLIASISDIHEKKVNVWHDLLERLNVFIAA